MGAWGVGRAGGGEVGSVLADEDARPRGPIVAGRVVPAEHRGGGELVRWPVEVLVPQIAPGRGHSGGRVHPAVSGTSRGGPRPPRAGAHAAEEAFRGADPSMKPSGGVGGQAGEALAHGRRRSPSQLGAPLAGQAGVGRDVLPLRPLAARHHLGDQARSSGGAAPRGLGASSGRARGELRGSSAQGEIVATTSSPASRSHSLDVTPR
jgi:hypothetical protein